MFTGIIQTIGSIKSSELRGGDLRLQIDASGLAEEIIALGDSVAVNGVCLTVVEQKDIAGKRMLTFDVSRESIDTTLIGEWQAGVAVNLELAMLPTTRFGGHIVSGHVDGVGEFVKSEADARSWRMWFKVPQELMQYIATKGSITIDGISLTVNGVENDIFHVNIVPHTVQMTTLGHRKTGDKVHLEIDVVARYLERLLDVKSNEQKSGKITESLLRDSGYIK
ncbi:MAG: riboflavin synthase [Arenicella sp.]